MLLRSVVLAAVVLLAGCTNYPVRNQQASVIDDNYGYRMHKLEPSGLEDTLVIVTASGGGTRATALALSTLQGLGKIALPNGHSLADEVDVISSVSGGSVAAGYFALKGPAGFETLEQDFIRKNGMTPIIFGYFNPVGLARFSTAGEERIDLLIDYLDKQLFQGATYQTLIDQKHRPFLILNAADMVEGVPFPFTQRKMDLLCSDMSALPLSVAVASSAAFPVALSPVTLTNYSKCAAEEGKEWPPIWATSSLDNDDIPGPTLWYDSPQRTNLARAENAYALGSNKETKTGKAYVHLLDGGIADNLGMFEPLRMLGTPDTLPSFQQDIDQGKIKKLIFVTVNARSFSPSGLDQQQATPGFFDMLQASIDSPIDRTTAGTAAQLRTLLFDEYLNAHPDGDPKHAVYQSLVDNSALISIDFDGIRDDACRQRYHSVKTNWSLKKEEIDALLEVGQALLANDPEYVRMLTILGVAQGPDLPTLDKACADLLAVPQS